jgi:hypothetical protein
MAYEMLLICVRAFAMLRITVIESSGNAVILRAEGRIAGSWVDELRTACDLHALGDGLQLFLELGDVSFVDTDGVRLLNELRREGAAFRHITPFVAEQLKMGRRVEKSETPAGES